MSYCQRHIYSSESGQKIQITCHDKRGLELEAKTFGYTFQNSKNAYFLFYDRQVFLDPVVKPLLKCLSATSAMTTDLAK